MKTAISVVNTEHIYCEANVLLDEGTQRSFITYAPANQLDVPLLKSESISLSAFGAQTSAGRPSFELFKLHKASKSLADTPHILETDDDILNELER